MLFRSQISRDLDIPPESVDALNTRVRYDTAEVRRALEGSGIACPPLASYADKLWSYYHHHMDPERNREAWLAGRFSGKTALITGASSGIGAALAVRLARSGAEVILVARREKELETVAEEIRNLGGRAHVLVADLSNLEVCDRVVGETLSRVGGLDYLILNAAKSIRRPLVESTDRFHDFQRTMQLNYFGAVRLAMGFLPSMRERRSGHIIHNSTWGVLFPTPRFAAYQASKSAFDTFLECFGAEFLSDNIITSSFYLPWVRTPMVAPTKEFEETKMLTPEQAAEWVADAIARRRRVAAPAQAIPSAILR